MAFVFLFLTYFALYDKTLKKVFVVQFAYRILNPLLTDLSRFPYELRAGPHFDRLHTYSKDAIISHILKISLHDLPPKSALLVFPCSHKRIWAAVSTHQL